jgi:cytidine deaminase
MNKKSLNIEFLEFESTKGLSKELQALLSTADSHLKNAYAPYSNFKVSAVCLLSNGELVIGTNQENGAFPSGLCAERVAIFAAKSQFPNEKVIKMVLTSEQSATLPVTPCGACRQVLIEYEITQNQSIELTMKSSDSKVWQFKSVSDILPFSFDGKFLKEKG